MRKPSPWEDPDAYVQVGDVEPYEVTCVMHGSLLISPDLAAATSAKHDHENEHGIFQDEEGVYYDESEDQYA